MTELQKKLLIAIGALIEAYETTTGEILGVKIILDDLEMNEVCWDGEKFS